ncbi:unnamed protein product [Coccothraustes coccothraustes]
MIMTSLISERLATPLSSSSTEVSPPQTRVAAKDSATRASINTAPATAPGVQPWPQGTAASTPARHARPGVPCPAPVCRIPPRCALSRPGVPRPAPVCRIPPQCALSRPSVPYPAPVCPVPPRRGKRRGPARKRRDRGGGSGG